MSYYRASITQKSWQFLKKLQKKYDFVLIGGWAVWLYTQQLKSKDIDIVIELDQLGRLREKFELFKNNRLKKYEIKIEEVSVDIYVPYYSEIGIKVEQILTDTTLIQGFKLPSVELLLWLKIAVWFERRGSVKGRKDFIDVLSLLNLEQLNLKKIKKWEKEFELSKEKEMIKEVIEKTTRVEELDLNNHQVAKSKENWLKKLI